ncbi:MAG TPA: VapC toxin family PIN domain ribonuclease [Candidatus Dormibacteraeota bacterium]|nr:VapC toxin family PIN domain ribonuclease [Candidatus Dormibacteraeota bacterium]
MFIAEEQRRPLDTDRLPDEAAVSVVTLAELELSVHMAETVAARAQRLATLRAVQITYAALPLDDGVASTFARLVADARRKGRRPKVQEMWIAATAAANDPVLFTQDPGFDDWGDRGRSRLIRPAGSKEQAA